MDAAATAAEVSRLEGELQQCVAALQFEEAAALRDRLKTLKAELAAEVKRLNAQLQQHVDALEFEAAAELRDRIRDLRSTSGASASPSGRPHQQPDAKLPKLRTVLVRRLPQGTTGVALRAAFPAAVGIQLFEGKPGKGRNTISMVTFAARAEAKAVASQGEVEVAGSRAAVRMADPNTCAKYLKSWMDEHSRTVCINKLPLNFDKPGLKSEFPTVARITLLKKQSHTNAFLVFNTAVEAQAAAANRQRQFGGTVAYVAMLGDLLAAGNKTGEAGDRTVFLPSLPLRTTESQLQQSFPTAKRIKVHRKESHAFAFVTLPEVEEAIAIAQRAQVEVAGRLVAVRLPVNKDSNQAKKRPSAETPPPAKHQKQETA
eukprot:EG_transcript_13258